MKTKNVPNLN